MIYKLYTCTTFKAKTVGINWTKVFQEESMNVHLTMNLT